MAAPIVTIYTSEAALLAALPPGTEVQDLVVGSAEIGDTYQGMNQDFGVTYQGNGSIEQIFEPPPGSGSEYWWSTTGPISFALDPTSSVGGVDSANGFVISYLTLAPGQPAPSVRITLPDGSFYDVGPLVGGPFEGPGELVFAFTSTEPFKAVSLGLDSQAPLMTQFVAFFTVPVPEPGIGLLLGTALLVSGRRLLRSGRKWK